MTNAPAEPQQLPTPQVSAWLLQALSPPGERALAAGGRGPTTETAPRRGDRDG